MLETRVGIRKFRDRNHLNQGDLAKSLNMVQGNISAWESGNGTPSFEACKKMLEMGITVEELFGFDYNEKQNLIKIEEVNSNSFTNNRIIIDTIKYLRNSLDLLLQQSEKEK